MKPLLNRTFALFALLCVTLMLVAHGPAAIPVAFMLLFVAGAVLAGTGSVVRGQLGIAPDTNDIASQLNLNEILDSAIMAFKRAILPLTMFATVFRNVQLKGTNKVEVPYYPLQGAKSQDYNQATGYNFATGAGSQTATREILINRRKYQALAFTGYELARLPMLNAQTLGTLKGELLAYDVIQDILSIATVENFGPAVFTGAANTFDSDSVIDIRTACNKNAYGPLAVADGVTNTDTSLVSATANFQPADEGYPIAGAGIPAGTVIQSVTNATTVVLSQATTATANNVALALTRPFAPWPQTGRGLLVNPDYDGALLKDNVFLQAYSVGTAAAIQEGRLPRILGFDYGSSAALPTNGENIVGMASYMSAILAAFSPIEPPPAVRAIMTRYDIVTDPDSEISLEYREWGEAGIDTEKRVIECNYGFTAGEQTALKLLKSA